MPRPPSSPKPTTRAAPRPVPATETAAGPSAADPEGSAAPTGAPPEPAVPEVTPAGIPVMATPGTEDPDLARLQADWSDVISGVGPATRALILECRPLAVDGNIVTLGFPEAKQFLKDVAERKRPEIEDVLSRVVGRSVGVRLVASNIELPGSVTAAEVRAVFGDLVIDVGDIE